VTQLNCRLCYEIGRLGDKWSQELLNPKRESGRVDGMGFEPVVLTEGGWGVEKNPPDVSQSDA
jgi:hypothetical protein